MFFSKKKNSHETACFISHVAVSLALLFATVMALANMLAAHYSAELGMWVFGTNAGPLSIIAFVIALTFFVKAMTACVGACELCMKNGKK